MEIKKGTKLKLKWQFLNEGEPVSLSDYSKFRLDVLDIKKVPQRTSVTLAENEVVFSIDTEKYENGRFSVRVDADGADGGLHVCHRDAFRIVPANAKSSLSKGGEGENYELTIQDDLSGHTQQGIEDKSFVVTFTMDAQENVTSNKTFAEISDKINAGEIVIGYVFRADGMKYEMLPTFKPGENGIVFSSVSYDEENKGIVYQVECYNTNLCEWSVVELAGGGGDTPIEIALEDNNYSLTCNNLLINYETGMPFGELYHTLLEVYSADIQPKKNRMLLSGPGESYYPSFSSVGDGSAYAQFYLNVDLSEFSSLNGWKLIMY